MLTRLLQLFDLSFASESKRKSQIIFLDEFRMVILRDIPAITELIVVDTLIPQDHPGNLRRLEVPDLFCYRVARVHFDHDRPLGTLSMDDPLIADPAQSVFVVECVETWGDLPLLVVKMEALIKQTHSTRADSSVPWDGWGKDAVIMEVPWGDDWLFTFVHGAQVEVVRMHCLYGDTVGGGWAGEWDYSIYTLDFSRRGGSSLRPWRGGAGRSSMNTLSEDDARIRCQPERGVEWVISRKGLRSLSDGSLVYLVSPFSDPLEEKL